MRGSVILAEDAAMPVLPPDSRFSVCMTTDDLLPAMTGVGVHVQQIARALVARGHRVSVLTSRRPGQPEVETWEGVRLHRCWTMKMAGFYQAMPSAGTIARILDQEAPQVVHHHYFGLLMKRSIAVVAARSLPQLTTYHFSDEVLTQPWFMRPLRGMVRRGIAAACNRCSVVVTVSQAMQARLPGKGITSAIRHIPNPIPLERLPSVAPGERTGFSILFAGRLAPEKNLPLLLDAFAILARERRDACLRLAGEGPLRAELERRCSMLGIAGRVEFLGQLAPEALVRAYTACDVFVLPSVLEMLSLVAIEAMWFGRPLIVTDRIVCARELVDHAVNGYIVDAADPAGLAARLRQLAADPDLRRQMGAAGRLRASAHREGPIIDELESLYRAAIHGSGTYAVPLRHAG